MKNLPIVDMFDAESDLSEPVKDLILAKVSALLVFDSCGDVASVCVVHYDV